MATPRGTSAGGHGSTDGALSSGPGEGEVPAAAARDAAVGAAMPPPTPSGSGIRDIFDDIGRSVVSFLENHPGVANVRFEPKSGAVPLELSAWERKHAPFKLPDDLKALLLVSNGLRLSWEIRFQEECLPLGCMMVNDLASILPVPDDGLRMIDDVVAPAGRGGARVRPSTFSGKVFDLDTSCIAGNVALSFHESDEEPQVWFRDKSCSWYFIAASFTDYFRLMIMHLGLPSWQYAFTDVGLDPVSKQWFRFLSPERLAIDIENCKLREITRIKRTSSTSAEAAAKDAGSGDSPTPSKGKSQLNLASIEASSKAKGSKEKSKSKRPVTAGSSRPPRSGDASGGAGGSSGRAGGTGSTRGSGPPSARGSGTNSARGGGSSGLTAVGSSRAMSSRAPSPITRPGSRAQSAGPTRLGRTGPGGR